ncbi:MAG: hypothetical protein B7X77_05815 [Caulobacter sp. 39-67-4]|nr:MAG: hypothetical protein B7X77_05815 [Caulobacter sp. 39-67-4]
MQIGAYHWVMDAAGLGKCPPPRWIHPQMPAVRLFRIADKVMMTLITAALIVGVQVSAITFLAQSL